jgi:hypothetical protein
MFPKSGVPVETDAPSRALTYLPGFTVKEPSLQVPLMESPHRVAPFLEPSIIHSPWYTSRSLLIIGFPRM